MDHWIIPISGTFHSYIFPKVPKAPKTTRQVILGSPKIPKGCPQKVLALKLPKLLRIHLVIHHEPSWLKLVPIFCPFSNPSSSSSTCRSGEFFSVEKSQMFLGNCSLLVGINNMGFCFCCFARWMDLFKASET